MVVAKQLIHPTAKVEREGFLEGTTLANHLEDHKIHFGKVVE